MNNKLLTRDNLEKRKEVSDPTYLFCNEFRSIVIFLWVLCNTWKTVLDILNVHLAQDFELVTRIG
jgi:hypothetical protein